jgi:hypothetical protein
MNILNGESKNLCIVTISYAMGWILLSLFDIDEFKELEQK